jgi:hypothetical protein
MARRFKQIVVDGPNFYETIVLPSFGDNITDSDVRNGFFGEFIIMDDVTDSKKIIDITPIGNILKRRDASCTLIPSYVGRADARRISVTELYGYVEHCAQEFYQGCLKDWRNGDPIFVDKIETFFRKAIREDLISLMYFGDVDRVDAAGAKWNTNKFDGIFKQYALAIASGRLPGAQTFNVPNAAISPANAKAYLEQMFVAQDELLGLMADNEKAFYIDKQWADAYEDYLIATGATNGEAVNYVQDGIKVRAYKGIPIFVNKIFQPILKQITGDANPHFGILTIRGNFIFATDKNYGEGPNLDIAFKVWYDWNTLQWKYINVLKAGTAIGLPEHTVLALPA